MKTKDVKIRKDMTMAEILKQKPDAAEVMQSYGLHCAGCSINYFETLEEGVLGHGLPEEDINRLVEEINNLKPGSKISKKKKLEGIFVTKTATDKIKELAKEEKKENYGLRIQIIGSGYAGFQYYMDFEEKPNKTDKIYKFDNVEIYVDEESKSKLDGAMVDYVKTDYGEGFQIVNDNDPKFR